MQKKAFVLLSVFIPFLFPTSTLFSQNAETSQSDFTISTHPAIHKFPQMQLISVDYGQLTPSDYKMKMKNKTFEEGTLNSERQFSVRASIPVFVKPKFMIVTSLRYKYSLMRLNNVEQFPVVPNLLQHKAHQEYHDFEGSVSFIYPSRLFGKEMLYNLNLMADGSDKGYEKWVASASAMMTLKRTDATIVSLGLHASSSQASRFPFFPIFRYQHMFKNSPWMIDIIAPQYVFARRVIKKNGRLSLGTRLDTDMHYLYPGQAGFKKTYTYERIDIRGEVMYEHIIAKNITLKVRGGASKCYSGVIREKGSKRNIIKTSQDMNGYFNVGCAFNLNK